MRYSLLLRGPPPALVAESHTLARLRTTLQLEETTVRLAFCPDATLPSSPSLSWWIGEDEIALTLRKRVYWSGAVSVITYAANILE